MLKSVGVFLVALNIALGIVVIVWLHSPPHGYKSDQREPRPQATISQHGVASSTVADAGANEKSSRGHDQKRWIDYLLDHLPDWFVAGFTGLLAVVTYLLVRSTNRLWEATNGLLGFAGEQAKDMKSSIAVAQKSAEAAGKSADTLRSAEQAWVWVERFRIDFAPAIDNKVNAEVSWYVRNVGRTPAFVTATAIRLWTGEVDEKVPDEPSYGTEGASTEKYFVYPDRGGIGPHSAVRKGLPPDLPARIDNETLRCYAYGYVEFMDVFERTFRSGFLFRMKKKPGEAFYSSHIAGPASYWYCRQKTDQAGA